MDNISIRNLIKSRYQLFIIIFILLAQFLGLIGIYFRYIELQDEIKFNINNNIAVTELLVRNSLDTTEYITFVLADIVNNVRWNKLTEKEGRDLLTKFANKSPLINYIVLLDNNGNIIFSSLNKSSEQITFMNHNEIFKNIKHNKYVGPLLDPITKTDSTLYISKITHKDDKDDGFVVTVINSDYIDSLCRTIFLKNGYNIIIFADNLKVLSSCLTTKSSIDLHIDNLAKLMATQSNVILNIEDRGILVSKLKVFNRPFYILSYADLDIINKQLYNKEIIFASLLFISFLLTIVYMLTRRRSEERNGRQSQKN